jgi:ribonucleoside-diphosphate reductase alpha subunit
MMIRVEKRDGRIEKAQFDKITNRISKLAAGDSKIGPNLERVSPEIVSRDVISRIADMITTSELDEFAAKYCASLATEDYQYNILGGRIVASNHQKNTNKGFVETILLLNENINSHTNKKTPLIKERVLTFILDNQKEIEDMIHPERDYIFDYFGFETLKKSYLLRRTDDPKVIETPQYMYMRIAIALNTLKYFDTLSEQLATIKDTYDNLSLGKYSHASPTMYNAGTHNEQLSSCFLLGIADSIDEDGGIPDCLKACSLISKRAGGIGIGIQPIRATGTIIAGTGGKSDGIIPMLRVFNNLARYVNQGGRRPGAIKVSLEPWHPDIYDFLDMKKNIGSEERRCRDLYYALWVPDLFMSRLEQAFKTKKAVKWSLMCPDKCPGLYQCYGDDFEKLYLEYESQNKYNKQVDIRHLWLAVLSAQKETGGPDILFKDTINRKNNQSNLGVIRNSNLCSEILEYSDEKEYAVCNLASISYVSHVKKNKDTGEAYFDFDDFMKTCEIVHVNLDNVIDINDYPVENCRVSNLKHRPVGAGTQGLADAILELGLSFELVDQLGVARINPQTRELNKVISECYYYSCLNASMKISKQRHSIMEKLSNLYKKGKIIYKDNGLDIDRCHGLSPEELEYIKRMRPIEAELDRDSHWGAYSSFIGSPISKGILQYHMWDVEPVTLSGDNSYGIKLDWESLISNILKYGVRNSLVRADMPTASTAQILGNSECTEPYKYVIYTRRVSAGEFVVVNKYLHDDLQRIDLWNSKTKDDIVRSRGSIKDLEYIPLDIRMKYRTLFEISKKTIHILAADRGAFIDQTQSMNLHVAKPTDKILTNMHIGGWKLGLKTGMYYLRREKTANPIQFTVDSGFTISKDDEMGDEDACTGGGCSA